jgi:hypothetical protein
MKAVRLLQGYIWHPRTEDIDLAHYLPRTLEPDIHILWDEMPRAPFTFFDDGTLSSTQKVYQFTVLRRTEDEDTSGLVPWVAETLQKKLESTPASVGWQIFEDLREL